MFGRNVTGGAVNLRNARPDGEFGAKVRVGLDDEEQFNVAAAIEGAIVEDKFFVKLAVYRDDDGGYFQNNNQSVPTDPATATFPAPHPLQPFYIQPATRQQVGEMETTLIRPTFVFRPSDDLEVTLIYENGSTEGDGAVWTNVTFQRLGLQADFSTTADEIGFTDIE